MVTESILTHKVIKVLEKYLINKSGFRLLGFNNYNLILLIPSDKYDYNTKYSLLLSSKLFDHRDPHSLTREMLVFFQQNLDLFEYNAISRINFIHSEDPFVHNIKYTINNYEPVMEIENVIVAGTEIEFGLILNTSLDRLVENRVVSIKKFNGEWVKAGIKNIDQDFRINYYTGKGLREIWDSGRMTEDEKKKASTLKKKEDTYLFKNGYL